ncbi:MAG: DEAD/DEAH box helicase, partial [Acidimicrobiales bacterium]
MTTMMRRPSEDDVSEPAPIPAATFEELGVAPGLVAELAAQGITTPFPVQALTIRDGIAGRDVCGKAKTGSGKTLAFGLPLLMRASKGAERRPRGLVLVPTRELAVQVGEVLTPLGAAVDRRVVVVYGGADIEKQIKKLRKGV